MFEHLERMTNQTGMDVVGTVLHQRHWRADDVEAKGRHFRAPRDDHSARRHHDLHIVHLRSSCILRRREGNELPSLVPLVADDDGQGRTISASLHHAIQPAVLNKRLMALRTHMAKSQHTPTPTQWGKGGGIVVTLIATTNEGDNIPPPLPN
jgi:hypothetical protein